MGKSRARREPVPPDRTETLRQRIAAFLERGPATLRDISGEVRAAEKEVLGHLEHLGRSLRRQGRVLAVTPAECAGCGFVFAKRGRLGKPGRCPVCRGESVHEPLYAVRERGGHGGGAR